MLERENCAPMDTAAIALAPVSITKSTYINNPIIHRTIPIWKHPDLNLRPLPFTTPLQNPSFPWSTVGTTFSQWKQTGIISVGNLYLNYTFTSFQQLHNEFNIPTNNFFRYLELRNFVKQYLCYFAVSEPDKLDLCFKSIQSTQKTKPFFRTSYKICTQLPQGLLNKHWKMNWESRYLDTSGKTIYSTYTYAP